MNAEPLLLLGGPRALLMQIAHPKVAAAVAQHSDFPSNAWGRLLQTLELTAALSFGDGATARAAADRINALHARIHGTTASGEPYDALDPDLLLWVHATSVDTALVVYERFVRPLPVEQQEAYYRETKAVARAVLVPPRALPGDLAAFRRYVEATIPGLEVTGEARRLAQPILRPPMPAALAPISRLSEFATTGLLPDALRRGYGLSWDEGRERRLRGAAAALRMWARIVPQPVRALPLTAAASIRGPSRARGRISHRCG